VPRALVTGGAGFIGSHVADLYLEHGYDVTVLDNFASGRRENVPSRAALAELDLTSADAARVVRDGRFDVVSHLGAQIDVRKSVADPMFDAHINIVGTLNLLEGIRVSNGNPVLYRRGAVRKALRLLAEGRGVGILIDQHMTSPDAIYVDFFGRPAATTSTLAALAMRTGAPIVPLFAFPLPNGRYRMIYEHPIEPPAQDSPDALREFTQRCTDVLEMHVRRHPELWLWMHRRWRDAPGPAFDRSLPVC